MKVHQIMTTPVVVAAPETSVHDIAQIMVDQRISAVPVVDDGDCVLGIITHSDLLHRHEIGAERKHSWWLDLLANPNSRAREYAKSRGLHAADVMTRPVISVTPDTDLIAVADLFEDRNIRRAPVVREGRLVGIVSRADVVRAFANATVPRPAHHASDTAIRTTLEKKLRTGIWGDGALVNFTVTDGVVELSGFVESEDLRAAIRVAAEEIDGVTAIEDRITIKKLPAFAY